MSSVVADQQRIRDWLWHEIVFRYAPYPLLTISLVASLISGELSNTQSWLAVGLSVLAAGWSLGFDRLEEEPSSLAGYLYFVGFLVLAAVLLSIHMLFFIYTISGFLFAVVLRPAWVGITGIFLTALWIHGNTFGLPPRTWGDTGLLVVIVLVQTASIGIGIPLQDRMEAQHERRRQLVAKLEAALEENAQLQSQLLNQARESGASAERQRLAREIHDTLAQGLAGIVTQLEAADQATVNQERRRHLDNATRLARDSLAEARRTVHAVSPLELEGARLSEAVQQIVDEWSELHQVAARMTTTGTPQALHPEVEVTLLRIAQEALANVAKHAGASRVGLTLSYMGDVVALDVRDDGRGFSPALAEPAAVDATNTGAGTGSAAGSNGDSAGQPNGTGPAARAGGPSVRARSPLWTDQAGGSGGFGLRGMWHRAVRLAGTFEVETEPGAGTAVSVRVPAISPGEGAS